MSYLNDNIDEYCSSQFFLLQGEESKEHIESILHFFWERVGEDYEFQCIERSLNAAASLRLPLSTRKNIPQILYQYLEWIEMTGMFAEVQTIVNHLRLCEVKYIQGFRSDGTVKGETFKKNYTAVGRNDPCPCGSGKKFKKCCG